MAAIKSMAKVKIKKKNIYLYRYLEKNFFFSYLVKPLEYLEV
jgi:hypothetical protein